MEQNIYELMKQETDAFVLKRLQIVAWKKEGVTTRETAKRCGKTMRQVCEICRIFRDGGVEALKSNNKGGNNRYLKFEKEKEAISHFAEQAKQGKFVRVSEMQKEFAKRTGVSYSQNAFYELLHRHGWRKVKPRGRHPKKASDEAIEASKKLTLLSWS